MRNPWEEISLSDYENHMRLASVKQLQAMNEMMKNQFSAYPVTTAMVLGVAGGNGLEHVDSAKYKKVYGVDINGAYLNAVNERYKKLGCLQCLQLDLPTEKERLPGAELVIANLFIEYIGYVGFQQIITQVAPRYVSCIIQINVSKESWVSDSPYEHVFDGLETVHHQIEESKLIEALQAIGYQVLVTKEYPLPNGKKLIQLDFVR